MIAPFTVERQTDMTIRTAQFVVSAPSRMGVIKYDS
jgi:hypothetical protein